MRSKYAAIPAGRRSVWDVSAKDSPRIRGDASAVDRKSSNGSYIDGGS